MKTNIRIDEILRNFPRTLWSHKEAIEFINENKLWKGMNQYGWLSKALVVIALVFAWYAYSIIGGAVEEISNSNHSSMFTAMGQSMSRLSEEGMSFFKSNMFKYVVFILMEVVIFHFARRTLEIKTGKDFDTSFDAFWKAEKRMIQVAIRCMIFEFILTLLISIVVGIFGLGFLKGTLTLIIQCYFLGFLMLDNYNEIFHLTIKESSKLTESYAGVALAIGLISYVLMIIPVLGTFLAPLLGAVAAALAMHKFLPAGPVSGAGVEVAG